MSVLLLQQLTRDNELLNLGSAFINAQGANISIEPFHYAAAHESLAAVILDRAIDNSAGCFGCV